MSLPSRQRQWDIYSANLGEGADCNILVISSNETNEILSSQILACEIVPNSVQRLPETPVTLPARIEDTGLPEAAAISVATLASLPRNCLVSLEGRLESVTLRLAVNRSIQILLGNEDWP